MKKNNESETIVSITYNHESNLPVNIMLPYDDKIYSETFKTREDAIKYLDTLFESQPYGYILKDKLSLDWIIQNIDSIFIETKYSPKEVRIVQKILMTVKEKFTRIKPREITYSQTLDMAELCKFKPNEKPYVGIVCRAICNELSIC